jgi:hypothetical protein
MGFQLSYMGTKKQTAPAVADVISSAQPGILLDAFAGMCAVGEAVGDRRQLWNNDVQVFASRVAQALFTSKRSAAADTIDNLYGLTPLKDHRAGLGGARSFIKTYRNVSSHAPRSARQAMDKIKKCRAGFFDAIRIAKDLQGAMKAKGMRTTIHLT